MTSTCRAELGARVPGVRVLALENEVLATSVLVDKGADLYELVHRPSGVDVLFKAPWGLHDSRSSPHASNPLDAWLGCYPGGWQELLPNGGPACTYRGAELPFHGEAAVVPWRCEIVEEGPERAEAVLSVRLRRLPLRLERRMAVEAGSACLVLRERLVNEGRVAVDFMWGHHPAFGAPLLAEGCRIDTGATRLRSDRDYEGTDNPLVPDEEHDWPLVATGPDTIDLSRIPPAEERRDLVAYLSGFDEGWFALTNPALGLGVGLAWDAGVFPYAWLWQDLGASQGYPWFGDAYVTAIEPNTSFPAAGLTSVIETTATHRTLEPGEVLETELRAVLFESRTGVARIARDGAVTVLAEERAAA